MSQRIPFPADANDTTAVFQRASRGPDEHQAWLNTIATSAAEDAHVRAIAADRGPRRVELTWRWIDIACGVFIGICLAIAAGTALGRYWPAAFT